MKESLMCTFESNTTVIATQTIICIGKSGRNFYVAENLISLLMAFLRSHYHQALRSLQDSNELNE